VYQTTDRSSTHSDEEVVTTPIIKSDVFRPSAGAAALFSGGEGLVVAERRRFYFEGIIECCN
jgi:hypothetical protein